MVESMNGLGTLRGSTGASRCVALAGSGLLLLPMASLGQSLDDAVNAQLQSRNTIACAELRNRQKLPDPGEFLTGPLLEICKRGGGAGGLSPSVSTGAGSAIPTSQPSIVQQRLREARGKQPKEKIAAASADSDAGDRGFFLFAETDKVDRAITDFEDGYRSRTNRLTAGFDLELRPRWIAGLALEVSHQNLDFDGGGNLKGNSTGVVGFTSLRPFDSAFTQLYAGYARDSYQRNRNGLFSDLGSGGGQLNPPTASGVQHADFDADQYRAGLLLGYDLSAANLTVSPFAGLDWRRRKIATYSETGTSGLELTFYGNSLTSLQTSLGLQASVVLRSGSWVLVPQASVSWKHELKDPQQTLEASFVGDTRAQRFTYQTSTTDRRWAEIDAGIALIFPSGIQAVGRYRTISGNSVYKSQAVTIGARIPF